jgi:hypothetical protein
MPPRRFRHSPQRTARHFSEETFLTSSSAFGRNRRGNAGPLMGLIYAFALFGLLVFSFYQFIFKRHERAKLVAEFKAGPVGCLFVMVLMIFFVMWFVGSIFSPFGMIQIDLGFIKWPVLYIGLVGFFGLILVGMIFEGKLGL